MQNIAIQTTQNVTIEYELASLRDRILAYLIDFMVVSVAYIFLVMLVANLVDLSGIGGRFIGLLPVVGFLSYQLFFEIFNQGQSWGKKSMRIRVVKIDGQEPSLSDYFLRAVFTIIDVMLSFGTIAMILISSSPKRQRLGDLTANTTVIKLKETLQFRLQDILKINTLENYEPKFPQVKTLTEKDMLLIKNTIIRHQEYPNEAHRKAIFELANHIKKVLDIQEPTGNQTEFLKNLIRDYIVLTR